MATTTDPGSTARTRRFALVAVAAAIVLAGAAGLLWFGGRGNGGGIGGPFALTDQQGRQVASRDFRGKFMLVYFGYTYCPDVCPTTLNDVSDAMDKLGGRADRVQPVSITVDPRRDTPAALKQYISSFTPRLVALTGTPEQIAAVAREYRVYYAVHRTGDGPDDYTMDHSSILYLMGPDGDFVAPIRADESGAEIAADIAKHLS